MELTATLPAIGLLHGTIDRLVVTAGQVHAIDYKSNSLVPDRPEATPEGVLRQMAAYRDALRLIYPGHELRVSVLWTASRQLMNIPDGLMDDALAALDPARLRS